MTEKGSPITLEMTQADIAKLLAGDSADVSKRLLAAIGIKMEVVLSSRGAVLKVKPYPAEKGVLIGNSHYDPDAVLASFREAIDAIEGWKKTILA